MRKGITLSLLILFVLCFSLLRPSASSAQGGAKFESLEIDLWPEYDQPTLLVIYRGVLAQEVSLPARLTFRIPTVSEKPTAVAVGPTIESVADVTYDIRVNGEWTEVSFLATAPAVQLEYYDPGLSKTGAERHFTYTWPGDYAVDTLKIQVQQPVGASEMNISPALEPGAKGGDGLTYHNKEIGSVAAGEPFTIQATYQKATDSLTVRNLTVEPGAPPESGGIIPRNMMAALPWILGVLGVILIVGGGFWYWQSGRGRESSPARRRRKPAAAQEAVTAEGHVYCHNCGKRAGPGDRFCRTCGTRLRVE